MALFEITIRRETHFTVEADTQANVEKALDEKVLDNNRRFESIANSCEPDDWSTWREVESKYAYPGKEHMLASIKPDFMLVNGEFKRA